MSSTSERDALAADLLADLAAPPVAVEPPVSAEPRVSAEPTAPAAPPRPRGARPTPVPAAAPAPQVGAEADADGLGTRGPALQTVLRLEPFDWYKPLLRIRLLSVSVRVGPVYAQLGVRR